MEVKHILDRTYTKALVRYMVVDQLRSVACKSSSDISEPCRPFQEGSEFTAVEDKSQKLKRLESRFYEKLLVPEHAAIDKGTVDGFFNESSYPSYPLCNSLVEGILLWLESNCPFTSRMSISLLDEDNSSEQKNLISKDCEINIEKIRALLKSYTYLQQDSNFQPEVENFTTHLQINNGNIECLLSNNVERYFEIICGGAENFTRLKEEFRSIFEKLGKRGILYLIGLRETVGSVNILPPPRWKLYNSFLIQHGNKSKLTVGARALSKHYHRSHNGWWGDCKGSEEQKNKHALNVLQKIIQDCVWINIHTLPHALHVLELRCSEGYGARWTCDGETFRGFLEPQMDNGHAVGWKH